MLKVFACILLLWLQAAGAFGADDGEADTNWTHRNDSQSVRSHFPKSALVIGVERYDFGIDVPNALNDANLIAEKLQVQGEFSTVRVLRNPLESEIVEALAEIKMVSRIEDMPALVVFFFAGHGYQLRGAESSGSYLAARDAQPNSVDGSVSLATVLAELTPKRDGVVMVFLDACRTYLDIEGSDSSVEKEVEYEMNALGKPFSPQTSVGLQTRGAIVSFAAEPGRPAASRSKVTKNNSPYAFVLAKQISKKGAGLHDLIVEVNGMVSQIMKNKQRAEVLINAQTKDVAFVRTEAMKVMQDKNWEVVGRRGYSLQCLRAFLDSHPDSEHAIDARRLLDRDDSDKSVAEEFDFCEFN